MKIKKCHLFSCIKMYGHPVLDNHGDSQNTWHYIVRATSLGSFTVIAACESSHSICIFYTY